ncbi:MAG: hypothetical protein IJU54_02530 [Alphaproteobacteria bacterium]|nr:hypothetical protein [Alphaproteobacteria bacterium]
MEQLNVDANNKNEITNMIFDNSAKNNVYKNGIHISITFSYKYYNFAIYDKEHQTNYNKSFTKISQFVSNLNKTI